MSLKENIEAVKTELNTEEQFLESMIKFERVFKKYKYYFITLAVVIILFTIGYNIQNYLNQQRLNASNSAFIKLQKDPNDKTAIATLKENNNRLYTLLTMQTLMKEGKSIDKSSLDDIQKSLLEYYEASSSLNKEKLSAYANSDNPILKDFATLQEGYLFLKEKNFKTANIKFSQIPVNSPLKDISKSFSHYQ